MEVTNVNKRIYMVQFVHNLKVPTQNVTKKSQLLNSLSVIITEYGG